MSTAESHDDGASGAAPGGALPPRAAAVAFVALIVAALVLAVVVGSVAPDASDPTRTIVGGFAAQLASLAAIVFVVRRYAPPQDRRLGLGGASLRTAVPLVVAAVVAGEAVYLLFDALVGTPEAASAARFIGEPAATIIAAGVLLVLIGPAVEEVLFRGVIFRALRSGLAFWPAALIASVLFALIHVPDAGGLEGFGPRLLTGLIFCGLFQRTGSLYPAIAVHIALNAIELGRASVGAAVAFGLLGVLGALLAQHLASHRPVLPDAPGTRAA